MEEGPTGAGNEETKYRWPPKKGGPRGALSRAETLREEDLPTLRAEVSQPEVRGNDGFVVPEEVRHQEEGQSGTRSESDRGDGGTMDPKVSEGRVAQTDRWRRVQPCYC